MPLVAHKTATLRNKKKSRQKKQSKSNKNGGSIQLLAPPDMRQNQNDDSVNVDSYPISECENSIATETGLAETVTMDNTNHSSSNASDPVPVPSSPSSSKSKSNDAKGEKFADNVSFLVQSHEEDMILQGASNLIDANTSEPNSLSSASFSTAASASASPGLTSEMEKRFASASFHAKKDKIAISTEQLHKISGKDENTQHAPLQQSEQEKNIASAPAAEAIIEDFSETKSDCFSSTESKESSSPPWSPYAKGTQEKSREMPPVNNHADIVHTESSCTGINEDFLDLNVNAEENNWENDNDNLGNLALMKTEEFHVQNSSTLDTNMAMAMLKPVDTHQRNMKPLNLPGRVDASPRELSASPGTSTGFLSQLVSRVPSTTSAMLKDINTNLEGYVPGFIKDYTVAGAEQRPDSMQKDTVLWTRFQKFNQKLYLMVGYTDGFQIWDLSDGVKVKEILSVRENHPVRIVQFLAHPGISKKQDAFNGVDLDLARPLIALCQAELSANISVQTENHTPFTTSSSEDSSDNTLLQIYSVAFHRKVKEFHFKSKILSVESNPFIVAVALKSSIHGMNARTLDKKFVINCYPSPSERGVLALGSRWLAYAGCQPVIGTAKDDFLSGVNNDSGFYDNTDADRAWTNVTTAAKGLATGLSYLGDLGIQYVQKQSSKKKENVEKTQYTYNDLDSLGDTRSTQQYGEEEVFEDDIICRNNDSNSNSVEILEKKLEALAGIVVIVDLSNSESIVANFRSHRVPIEMMAFNPTGSILATAPIGGRSINIHRIIPRGNGSLETPSHRLLYSLERGLTAATIRCITFSDDLRWVCATSSRGTTHIFAISPNGGPVNAYSHPVIIVNKKKNNDIPNKDSKDTKGGIGSNKNGGWTGKVVSVLSNSLPTSFPGSNSNDVNWHLGSGGAGMVSSKSSRDLTSSAHDSTVIPVFRPPQRIYKKSTSIENQKRLKLYVLARIRQTVHMDSAKVSKKMGPQSPNEMGLDIADCASSCSTPSKNSDVSSTGDIGNSRRFFTVEDIPVPVSTAFVKGTAELVVVSSSGILEKYSLIPLTGEDDKRKLCLRALPVSSWDVCRRASWPDLNLLGQPASSDGEANESTASFQSNGGKPCTNVNIKMDVYKEDGVNECDAKRADWLSNVEIQTHARPMLPVWASPQIRFMVYAAEEEKKEHMPLFVDNVKAHQIEIRGEGPCPKNIDQHDLGQEGNEKEHEHAPLLQGLKFAIDTPARFQNFEEPSENEINEMVLLISDDEEEDNNTYLEENADEEEDIFPHEYDEECEDIYATAKSLGDTAEKKKTKDKML